MQNEINEIEIPSLSGSKKNIDLAPYIEKSIENYDGYESRIKEILGNYDQPNTLSISKNSLGEVSCDVSLNKDVKSSLSFFSDKSEEEIAQSIIDAGINRVAAHVQHNRSFRAGDVHGVPSDASVFDGYKGVAMEGLERFAKEDGLPYSLAASKKEYDLTVEDDDLIKSFKARMEDYNGYDMYKLHTDSEEKGIYNKVKNFFSNDEQKRPEYNIRRPRP